ncbi:terpenoid synthase [Gloeophyllum trabeum ATCC 11539]|uniref:Terpene synthase n=1 Tax=Gloeophyllum trabeum (strain ATCC 11539 / FP-39264 / Madison 617) TaxID=670483 RepID=S7PXE8_GLOTA|nr:terpenoid synthase [Gloeophyllum trabeum ATCC 11539]EPQ52188.1 terpenoid synthase [Gloeophyllum trabeum ATCC 11539]
MHLSCIPRRSRCLSTADSPPAKIVLPDLVSHCDFPLRTNVHCARASKESEEWFLQNANLNKHRRADFLALKAGELTSMCYPYAPYHELRVCCDFMNYLFHLDDLMDDMKKSSTWSLRDEVIGVLRDPDGYRPQSRVGKMTRDFWTRLATTSTFGVESRFIKTFDAFFSAVSQQAYDRQEGHIPDLESYIAMRRDTSGCRPCWALIEYAYDLAIPDEVMEHPILCSLGDAANDLVTWSNDIFSYNNEQARGDTHNMIVVVMKQKHLSLQSAVDFVGSMCKDSIDRFVEDRANLPSWGPGIDDAVARYVQGLADWIVGSLHWSFDSGRYFGDKGKDVKMSRVVELLPRSR